MAILFNLILVLATLFAMALCVNFVLNLAIKVEACEEQLTKMAIAIKALEDNQ